MLTLFKRLKSFFTEPNVYELRKIKRTFSMIFSSYDESWQIDYELPTHYQFGLTKIELNNNTIVLHCMRPGILIGKGGKTIDSLKLLLSKLLDKEYSISLKEVSPFE